MQRPFLQQNLPIYGQTTRIDIARPVIKTNKQADTYYFYFGPKTSAELGRYDYADKNSFQTANFRLEDAMDHSNILGWLETFLKFCLNIFYKIVPNYGVAIILVTILVKALLFPLTKKGSIASAQMQEIQPKMQALQAKYKNNPEKLNKEMAEFYKTEGIKPHVRMFASSHPIPHLHRDVQSLQHAFRSARGHVHSWMDP